MLGSIEAGGTKFVCSVGTDDLKILKRTSFPTVEPAVTMAAVADFFGPYQDELTAVGVGSFGPVDINKSSATYGWITSTPKLLWQNFDLLSSLKEIFSVPIALTTDVNGSAYGEYVAGSGADKNSLVYYTVGTGVGGGAIQDGKFVGAFSHPEMGHMLVTPVAGDDFAGSCPFHGHCLEGMAAGPAIEKRLGRAGATLAEDDPYWTIEADYLAQCVYNTTLMLRPELIILGGGVMHQPQLLALVKKRFIEILAGYVAIPAIDKYLVTPELGDNAATIGCLALAQDLTE